MKIHINFLNGNVYLDDELIASSVFNLEQIEAMGKSMLLSKAAKKSRLYFRCEHDLTWESLDVDSLIIECHLQKCEGCVINLDPIASCNTSESFFTLVTSKINVAPAHIEITGTTSRTCRFDWGTIDFIYDPHYAAISIDLKYKS